MPPSSVVTLMRSSDSSKWKFPFVPSAHELLIVLGWLGSAPPAIVSRPTSSVPESHEPPTVLHLGAMSVASNTAVASPLDTTTNSNILLLISEPSLAVSVIVVEPNGFVVGVIVTVRLAPDPPNTRLLFGTIAVFDDMPDMVTGAAPPSSPTVKLTTIGVFLGVDWFAMAEIVGAALGTVRMPTPVSICPSGLMMVTFLAPGGALTVEMLSCTCVGSMNVAEFTVTPPLTEAVRWFGNPKPGSKKPEPAVDVPVMVTIVDAAPSNGEVALAGCAGGGAIELDHAHGPRVRRVGDLLERPHRHVVVRIDHDLRVVAPPLTWDTRLDVVSGDAGNRRLVGHRPRGVTADAAEHGNARRRIVAGNAHPDGGMELAVGGDARNPVAIRVRRGRIEHRARLKQRGRRRQVADLVPARRVAAVAAGRDAQRRLDSRRCCAPSRGCPS